MTAAQVAIAVGGAVVAGDRETALAGVSTDSRSTAKGNLFVALTGEKFDGHEYVGNAAWKGAAAALVLKSRVEAARAAGIVLIAVDEKDTLAALGRLGRAWRETLSVPVVGITGSAGKS